MKQVFGRSYGLVILAILVLTNCADTPDDLREEAKYDYCISEVNGQQACLAGPFTASNCNGQVSNNCPNGYYQPSSGSQHQSSSLSSSSACANPSSYGSFSSKAIGGKTWMTENLNYAACGSKCYDNDPANCAKYGRLYDWATAMALPASCNSNSCSGQIQTKHRGVCPSGWHIPSNAEWDQLFRYADGTNGTESPYDSPTAGRYLKATSGWNSGGNGEDTYGFAALPGGNGYSGGNFNYVGDNGYWWSASEGSSGGAYDRGMYYNELAYWEGSDKDDLFSVRCVKD
jgi:uncharacterized protein (TIGR02145 family)